MNSPVSKYQDGAYLEENATWHVEDSPWKAQQVLRIMRANGMEADAKSFCEVGCGAGEVLVQLHQQLAEACVFTGYDISPQLEGMWRRRQNERIKFLRADFLDTVECYDVLLLIDVVEHIEDYIGFLRKIRPRARYKVFNFPLEIFAAKALLGHKYLESRAVYGHIHYFNKDIVLSVLGDLGYEIIDFFYAPGAIDLAKTTCSISRLSKMARIPRRLLSKLSVDFAAKLLGGYSLFVLAK